MPAEVSGNAPLASGRLDDLRFMQTLTRHPAPEPAPLKPVAVQPPAPEPVAVEPPPPEPDPATPIEDLATVYEPPPPPPPPLPQAPEPPPSLSGQPTLPPGGIQVRVRPATRRFRGTTTISQLPAIRGPILARVAGEPHATFLIGVGATPSLGRERTNEVVLRAFKNQVVDSVASNRLSRKHLELDRGPEGFTVTDLKSAYGTELNGARLAPRTPTLLAPSFRLDLANQAAGLVGRCLDGALDLRRDDACGHRYLLVWPGARVPVGGADAGGLPLGGVGVCGWLSFDPELERFTLELAEGIDAQFGPARVQTGVPHPLVSGSVLVGGVELRMRALNAPYDFFSVGDKLAV
ncbi:MAG: FHA domain-containing protein [Planctomycetota bacterium]